ncbi:MAG: hypothetical protein ACXWPS_03850 [Ktedonobacteraceae bacterium]
MDDESTQQEQSLNEDAPTLDANRTIEDENLIVGNELSAKENVSSQAQTHGTHVEAQYAVGGTSSPTRQRTVTRIILNAVFLLVGIVLGVVGMLLFQLSIGGTRSPVPVTLTPVASGNVTVHADQSIITPLLQNSVQTIDLPANGSISNVQIQFTNGTQMNITGDYQISVLGVPVTQPFTLDAQLIVDNCQVQIHILQANFSNISVTGLVSLFEDKINQKLAQLVPQNNIPANIELCLMNVTTDTQGINASFNLVLPSSATPTANRSQPIAIL